MSTSRVYDVRIDRRAAERKPVNIPAAVYSNYREELIAATILDRSEGGAKIKIEQNLFLPKTILLIDFHNGSIFECEVRWRENCYLGVLVIDEYSSARRRRFFQTHKLGNGAAFAYSASAR